MDAYDVTFPKSVEKSVITDGFSDVRKRQRHIVFNGNFRQWFDLTLRCLASNTGGFTPNTFVGMRKTWRW